MRYKTLNKVMWGVYFTVTLACISGAIGLCLMDKQSHIGWYLAGNSVYWASLLNKR